MDARQLLADELTYARILSTMICEVILAFRRGDRRRCRHHAYLSRLNVRGYDMPYVWLFFAGAFFCNAIPHLASGLQGLPFPTPFARPRGRGDSSPIVNVVWGFVNIAIAIALGTGRLQQPATREDVVALLAGGLIMGLFLAFHFGAVQREKRAD
ncbi:hypothetical protein [Paraburkholderia nodosa]|uniref:hypothetical protein n=1 Tax=Paraburkholderia nodosa TaxID=392320 RepID=UPI002ADE5C24|nr:hypothetical protein [Paraburkholderia nodosa]